MKHLIFFIGIIVISSFLHFSLISDRNSIHTVSIKSSQGLFNASDTCIIEGLSFRMLDYKSTKKLKAYIKNSQIYVESKGLQYAKFRITYYIFSSLDDEQMPVIRHFDQRLSPPVLKVLKNARIGNQFLFEEIVVIDPSNKELTNAVRPILLERIKN